MAETLKREEAIDVLRAGHEEVCSLVSGLSEPAVVHTGLGGGDWSVKDLLGHLTSWEEHALGAIEAWLAGRDAPIGAALSTEGGVDNVNAETLAAKSALACARIQRDFEDVHSRLLEAIASMSDADWQTPVRARPRTSRGDALGSILSGTGPFGHAGAHLDDLRMWVGTLT
ncbi:MAG TPA: maleylpyruvate isomerase N-terminal domain-containing protein [Dehalococcoidia bacterium]|nr:maleylpyruvate isomerase N-terminal domain-containing protein [Dehalococcoidia bacterium]